MSRCAKVALAVIAFVTLLVLLAVTEPGPTECDDSPIQCESEPERTP